MRTRSIVLCLVALGMSCKQDERAMDCNDPAAAAEAAGRRGVADVSVDADFQAWLAACAGAPADLSVLIGRVRADLLRLVRLIIADKISPAEYLAGVRDRMRKVRLGRRDPTWPAALAKGDDDHDQVPNDRDRCPETPELTATDDGGCPTMKLPAAPDRELVQQVIRQMGFLYSPACDGSPVPSQPAPVRLGYTPEIRAPHPDLCIKESIKEQCFDLVDNNCNGLIEEGCPADGTAKLEIVIGPSTNQAAGCLVYYQVEIEMRDSRGSLAPASSALILRAADGAPDAKGGLRFTILRDDAGPRGALWQQLWKYDRTRWRVRTVNGGAGRSQWTALTDR